MRIRHSSSPTNPIQITKSMKKKVIKAWAVKGELAESFYIASVMTWGEHGNHRKSSDAKARAEGESEFNDDDIVAVEIRILPSKPKRKEK